VLPGYNQEQTMTRSRRTVAFACVALVVMAAVFPLGGTSLDWLLYTPDFVLLPPASAGVACVPASIDPEQRLALLPILEGRGPPPDSRSV
jgi:hypothetical protein